jgi:GNAT superfamily N-acetyltransferase
MTTEIRTGPQTAETRDRILGVIDAHARALGLPFDGDHLQVEAWDGDRWLGGLTGRTHQRWVYVELLGVAEGARGQDVGTRLMEAMEALARERGLAGLWLDTYSFQAPGFYARLGYEEIGRIPGYPGPHARIFLAKRLDGRPVSEGTP